MNRLRILVSSGATREPIDQVRFITNFSTGRTGAELARSWAVGGHHVTYLAGEVAELPAIDPTRGSIEVLRFSSFSDLNLKFEQLLSQHEWDWVVHLAAVGDYSVASIQKSSGEQLALESAKIDSSEDLTIQLKRNFKIVGKLRKYVGTRAQQPKIVAFKLTNRATSLEQESAVAKLLKEPVDLVIHNDLAALRSGYRLFSAFDHGGKVFEARALDELAQKMLNWRGEG
jgi:phosphopantothenoylcysteine synthetase/decarboxylase